MWRMLQQDEPRDYILATNKTYSIKEFLELAFSHVQLDWRDYVEFDARFLRPAEVDLLQGSYEKAKKYLNWEPKTDLHALTKLMVDADLKLAKKEKLVGHTLDAYALMDI